MEINPKLTYKCTNCTEEDIRFAKLVNPNTLEERYEDIGEVLADDECYCINCDDKHSFYTEPKKASNPTFDFDKFNDAKI